MTAPIHQTPSPAIDLAIALEESRERERVLRDELNYKESVIQALNDRNANHRQTLAGIRDMQKLEHAQQWAKDALSGYAQPVEATLLELTQENHALLAEITELRRQVPQWVSVDSKLPKQRVWVNVITDHSLGDYWHKQRYGESKETTVAELRYIDEEGNAYWQRGQLASGHPFNTSNLEHITYWSSLPVALLPATPDQTNEQ